VRAAQAVQSALGGMGAACLGGTVAGPPPVAAWLRRLAGRPYNRTRRSRRAFTITETELRLIAALAIIGERSRPVKG